MPKSGLAHVFYGLQLIYRSSVCGGEWRRSNVVFGRLCEAALVSPHHKLKSSQEFAQKSVHAPFVLLYSVCLICVFARQAVSPTVTEARAHEKCVCVCVCVHMCVFIIMSNCACFHCV